MTFLSRITQAQKNQDSLLCVGLDPDPRLLPASVLTASNPVLEFNRRIIGATHDLVCAYKLNLAFYEALGESGWKTLRETLLAIPEGVISIADGKRGDIGNSSEYYAKSFVDLGFHASTVNPYMGFDSVEPFLRDPNRGAFILTLTSNSGSKDFQRLNIGNKKLYEKVVMTAKKWNNHGNVGLVVGATHPKELKGIRRLAAEMPILIPGVGKQGGDLESAVRFGCNKIGQLAIINVGRSILFASSGDDFAAAARTEATKMRDEMRRYRDELFR